MTINPGQAGTRSNEVRPGQIDDSVEGEVTLTLPANDGAPALARAYVQRTWPDLNDDALSDVTLIVSELVSNAIEHGSPEFELRLRRDPFALDVAVLDHGENMPPADAVAAGHDATRGRGLFLIDNLASRWGVDALDQGIGKTVWASIDYGRRG